MVIPSQAGFMTGRCRDLTADSNGRRESPDHKPETGVERRSW